MTINKTNLPTGYSPTFEYALSYNREQAFAAFAAFMSNFRIDLEKVGEGVVIVFTAVMQTASIALIFGTLLILMLAIV